MVNAEEFFDSLGMTTKAIFPKAVRLRRKACGKKKAVAAEVTQARLLKIFSCTLLLMVPYAIHYSTEKGVA